MSIQPHNSRQNTNEQEYIPSRSIDRRRNYIQNKLNSLQDRVHGVENYQQYTADHFNYLNGQVCFFFQAYYNQQQTVIEDVRKQNVEIADLRGKLSEAHIEISSLKENIEKVQKTLEEIQTKTNK